MKKTLTWLCSLALATSLTCMQAAAPKAAKLSKDQSMKPSVERLAPAKAATNRFVAPVKRQVGKFATPKLSKAQNFIGAVKRPAALLKSPYSEAASTLPTIYGMNLFQSNWTEESTPGAGFGILPSTGDAEFTVLSADLSGYGNGGVIKDGVYYVTSYMSFWGMMFITVDGYDIEAGDIVFSATPENVDAIPIDQTYNPADGKIYGIHYNAQGTGLMLCTVEYVTDATGATSVEATEICAVNENVNSIAAAPDGQLYLITYDAVTEGETSTTTASYLKKIDPATGAITTVGETGQLPHYLSSSEIDPKSGRMFWTVCPSDDTGSLYEVNLSTGAATKIYDFLNDNEITGLAIPAPSAEDKAPAAPENLAANFADGSLSGTITFNAPATTFDGEAATGSLSYTVTMDDVEKATGTTSYGAAVSVPLTLDASEAGTHTFTVVLANTVGNSPKAKVSLYVGPDVPVAPESVELAWADGTMTLTWSPVTTGVNGGYVDPAAVKYTVTRTMPDNTVVAENISATTWSEAVAEPEALEQYCYSVVAVQGSVKSAATASNVITLGNIVPPYTNDFADDANLDGFTILDGNNDGKVWGITDGHATMSYNSSLEMDDWLMTPPVKLEAGKVYEFSLAAWSRSSTFIESVEVKMGKAATAAAMTTSLVAKTQLECTANDPMTLTATIVPEADGLYYIGIHGCSAADQFTLYVDDLSISAGSFAEAPDAPAIAFEHNVDVPTQLTVKVTAPSTAISGTALTSLEKMELLRDGQVITTFTDVTPGQTYTYVDDTQATGTFTYSAAAYNANGRGKEASVSQFAGVDAPAAPQNVTIVETATEGEVSITWDAVTTDKNGNPLRSSDVTYDVMKYNRSTGGWDNVAEGLTVCTATHQSVAAGEEQAFVQYAVMAVTAGGEQGTTTDMIPVGAPYDGMTESFADGNLSYILGLNSSRQGAIQLGGDESIEGLTSQDSDNGFIYCQVGNAGDGADIFTGKVSLANLVNPTFSYWVYTISNEDTNATQVYVREMGGEYTALNQEVVNNTLGSEGWNKISVDLSAYAGKTVQVLIAITNYVYAVTVIDNLKIGSTVDNDLVMMGVSAPGRVKAGSEYDVIVSLLNDGALQATGHKVELYVDGKLADTKDCEALASGEKASLTFTTTMHELAEEEVSVHAVVVHDADQNTANNTSEAVKVTPIVSNLPAPQNLTAAAGLYGGATLTWDEPNLDGEGAETVTEGFESAEAFAQEFAGWTFVDVDQSAVGGFQGIDLPGITAGEAVLSFFVADATYSGFNQSFASHSGDKYLASLFRYDDGQVDDWAISPALSGFAQTVSFYAKSYSSQYPETIEMYYSTGSLNPSDFVKVDTKAGLSADWTEYSFSVPEGAKYFAIRSCASGSFMLMLDDFTYDKGSSLEGLELLGYNVYCDGVKVNTGLVTENTYDHIPEAGAHVFRTTAVFNKGMSKGSNEASITTALDNVTAAVEIAGVQGHVIIKGAEGARVVVAAADGKVIFAGAGEAAMSVPASAGVYAVKVGAKVAKVVVR